MKLATKLAAGLAVLALGAVPTVAGATGPQYAPEHPTHPTHPAHPTNQPNGHAYGYYCRGESKQHVEGTPGTPFSACVKAAARAAHNEQLTARKACKALSKKHVKGQKGTPFSVCVKGVAQMRKEKAQETTTGS
ncbi:MAG TPA: hypothetical protein VFK14_09505 [Solirubrobacterales bacterium]|nr:hypothetical protein [Solirubrobacterales bacterium]